MRGTKYRRKPSIAAALLDNNLSAWNSALTKDLFVHGREIGPLDRRTRQILGHDARDESIAFSEFHGLARAQPCLQTARILKLPNVYTWHVIIVSQIVTHVKS